MTLSASPRPSRLYHHKLPFPRGTLRSHVIGKIPSLLVFYDTTVFHFSDVCFGVRWLTTSLVYVTHFLLQTPLCVLEFLFLKKSQSIRDYPIDRMRSTKLSVYLALCLLLLGGSPLARCEEDETDEGVVEEEGGAAEDGSEEGSLKNVSPDAVTKIFFTNPSVTTSVAELPAGRIVEFLVGFSNKGDEEFIVDSLEASFRYPMDFKYHIQNFSAITYAKSVKPKKEATLAYSFIPADAFAGRPIGLTINLAYRDASGNAFFDPVFNETVQIVEFDEGFDSEVFFMYLFLIAGCILLLFLVFSFIQSKASKKKSSGSRPVETGTSNDDVDYEWIPKTALLTPKSSRTSPRQRRTNRNAASSDTE